jgi:hypothetical protein
MRRTYMDRVSDTFSNPELVGIGYESPLYFDGITWSTVESPVKINPGRFVVRVSLSDGKTHMQLKTICLNFSIEGFKDGKVSIGELYSDARCLFDEIKLNATFVVNDDDLGKPKNYIVRVFKHDDKIKGSIVHVANDLYLPLPIFTEAASRSFSSRINADMELFGSSKKAACEYLAKVDTISSEDRFKIEQILSRGSILHLLDREHVLDFIEDS